MKPTATSTAMRASLLLGALVIGPLAPRAANDSAQPCITTHDAARRPLEVLCFDSRHRLMSRTYVDTVGRRLALPVRLAHPARFGDGPGALAEYLHLAGPWPGNVHVTGRVFFTVLIGADGAVRDARLVKSLDAVWPGCSPLARRRVLAMPHWQPAVAAGKAVPSLQTVSVRFGY